MGFGLHPNSNVAQQLSEALNDLFREDVDAIEDPILERDTRASAQRWLASRRRLEARVGALFQLDEEAKSKNNQVA